MKALVLLAALLAAAQARSAQVENIEGQDAFLPEAGDSRIVSGGPAGREQFPYNVAIYLNGRSFCGGSLISQRWVLTAAACASGIATFTVYLGAINLNSIESGRVIVETTSKIVHPGYSSLLQSNNVALVNLGRDVTLSSYIQPISLANVSSIYINQTAILTGWKLNASGSTQVGSSLQYAVLIVVDRAECSGGGIILSSNICAKFADGRSSCGVDVGSPLALQASGQQIGLVHSIPALCAEGAPVTFTSVVSYASWISSNTGIGV